MKKIKVSEATTIQLNWMVARALGKCPSMFIFKQLGYLAKEHNHSMNWEQGGPLIEREKITTSDCEGGWVAGYNGTLTYFGPTLLIAAIRCFVASKLGDEVEVPNELN